MEEYGNQVSEKREKANQKVASAPGLQIPVHKQVANAMKRLGNVNMMAGSADHTKQVFHPLVHFQPCFNFGPIFLFSVSLGQILGNIRSARDEVNDAISSCLKKDVNDAIAKLLEKAQRIIKLQKKYGACRSSQLQAIATLAHFEKGLSTSMGKIVNSSASDARGSLPKRNNGQPPYVLEPPEQALGLSELSTQASSVENGPNDGAAQETWLGWDTAEVMTTEEKLVADLMKNLDGPGGAIEALGSTSANATMLNAVNTAMNESASATLDGDKVWPYLLLCVPFIRNMH